MDGKWPMSLEDEWLSNSLKLSACQYLCLYHPCMIGIPTSSYTKCQISQKVAGAGFILGFFSYCKSICHLWTLSINAMANWCIHEITKCGHDPRKATCVTPACHRVLLSRPGSALLSPAYDGIADGVKFRIRSVNFVDSAGASVDVKKMPTDFLLQNAEQKDMGFHACDLKMSTNVIQIVSTHQHHPLLHLRWSGWAGQVPWHMVLGHDSSTYIYYVNIVIVAYSVQFAFSDSLHLR